MHLIKSLDNLIKSARLLPTVAKLFANRIYIIENCS